MSNFPNSYTIYTICNFLLKNIEETYIQQKVYKSFVNLFLDLLQVHHFLWRQYCGTTMSLDEHWETKSWTVDFFNLKEFKFD